MKLYSNLSEKKHTWEIVASMFILYTFPHKSSYDSYLSYNYPLSKIVKNF